MDTSDSKKCCEISKRERKTKEFINRITGIVDVGKTIALENGNG